MAAHGRKKRWHKVVTVLAAIVVFCTTYALIMPAVTMLGDTYCGYEEHIEHTDKCFEEADVLVCTLSEEGHTHTDQCYEERSVLTCTIDEAPEGHIHDDTCYEEQSVLLCNKEETDGHQHDESCYTEETSLICDSDDPEHIHDDSCYETTSVLSCTLPECEPHHHDENCYGTERVLICEEEETASHIHDASCYTTELVLVCGLEEQEPHQHTEDCYERKPDKEHPICGLPIHKHSLQCYSDPDADVESSTTWEKSFSRAEQGGNWAKDVIAVAETQVGYVESSKNYEVQEDGTSTNGYTRYGDWFGSRYADWDAMFCAFCLHYAGVDGDLMPIEADSGDWVAALSTEDKALFRSADDYLPSPGDLVFFSDDPFDPDRPEARRADHVGFVQELVYDNVTKQLSGLHTIEGDIDKQVVIGTHSIHAENILGYGTLPSNPAWFSMEAETETGIRVSVEGLRSSLPYPAEEIVLSAHEIISVESADLLASRMEADGIDDMASILMDVSLLHDEEIVEPVGPVGLSFVAPDVDADSTVYHIDEENQTVTEMTAEVNEYEGAVSLETEHFSIFALTLKSKGGKKTVTATVNGSWESGSLSNVSLDARSNDQMFFNYDVYNGESWTIGAGTWTTAKSTQASFDITSLLSTGTLNTKYRVRIADSPANPENDKSGYSEEFSLYDILDSGKPGFSEWVADSYITDFGGTRPTTAAALIDAFADYEALPTLTLESSFTGGELVLTATTNAAFDATYVWKYYDTADGTWKVLSGETGNTLNASAYSKLTPGADPLLDGGKNVRCELYDGNEIKASAVIQNVNPLKEVYDAAIAEINSGLHLNAFSWYLSSSTTPKTADVTIGGKAFMDYFYYDNVARDPDVPFYDGESYANYLASEYLRIKDGDENNTQAALDHVKTIWDRYIFDIFNPNPGAGVVGNYSYYPGANGSGPISTYGDKIIEWPKDNASSFHDYISGVERNGEDGLIADLSYDFLEGGVDYSRFIQSIDKTATADKAGDNNTERTYDIDITAETQATSVSPLAMLITVQTSWQMFDYPHANCVAGDGTYTSIEVGGAQHNTEMANLYDIKQAILRFIDYMDENFPGNNLVLGINEVQHGGSYNLINYNVSTKSSGTSGGKNGGNNNGETIYVSNNSALLRHAVYNWDSFGNCEHVHYDTTAMTTAAGALQANLTNWKDEKNDPIQYSDINKVAVIIGGGTENSNGTNGYGCALPWGTFYSSNIDAVYGIRTNVGEPLNPDGVLSWLDYYKNNTGNPYSRADSSYSGASTGNFTAKYVASSEDAIYNYLVRIAQKELKSKGVKVEAEDKHIDDVKISDTVNDEFRLEDNKPFSALVKDKLGRKYYETVVTPTAYDTAGNITAATAEFIVYNTDGTVASTVSPEVTITHTGNKTDISFPVETPYDYFDKAVDQQKSGTHPYTQKLSITQNADHTTDVSFDYGTVYNTHDATLHFEVIARDDYIGSNNVFTNDGLPSVGFKHIKLDRDGNEYHDKNGNPVIVDDVVEGYDTPEVNVPIRFTADNGGEVTVVVKTPVNLEDLSTTEGGTLTSTPDRVDSEYITATVHDLIDNYDQINGTVSYTWVVPGGKEYRVPVSLHVTDGDPDGSITAASEMAQQWIPKASGVFDVALKVTFTPDPVADNGNFANDNGVTATRVTAVTKEGHETIVVTSPSGDITGGATALTVSKVWSGEKGNTDDRPKSIVINLYQDGEFYDQQTVNGTTDGWKYTFKDLPYQDPDNLSHVYEYTVTEEAVPGYETSYGTVQTVPPLAYYWVEVPYSEVELDGNAEEPTEYLIVDKSRKLAIVADAEYAKKGMEVPVRTKTDGAYPACVDSDALSYFPDDDYPGWRIVYDGGTANGTNFIETFSKDTTFYIKKDGAFPNATGNDTRLTGIIEATANGGTTEYHFTNGKIKLNGDYLKMKDDATFANDGGINNATAFSFYVKVANTDNPTYSTSVTNTYIPGGELTNETSVTVNKVWIGAGDDKPAITLHLLRNGKEIDRYTIDSSSGWSHTFDTLPGSDDPLPYFDPLTGEPYVYSVIEDDVDGYETGYKTTAVKDASGGMHYVLFNESSGTVQTTPELWGNTSYVLITRLTSGDAQHQVTKDYMIGLSSTGFVSSTSGFTIRTDANPSTSGVNEPFTFGNLTCSAELAGTIPAAMQWTVERAQEPKNHTDTYFLKSNGTYLAVKKDKKTLVYTQTAKDKDPSCHWQIEYDSTSGTAKFYAMVGDNYNEKKYLTVKVENNGKFSAGLDGDEKNAAAFTIFEQVSLQSKYDTYDCEVQNISTAQESADGKVENHKYIDYLSDNIPGSATENPDTELRGDYYRLYLDACGTRGDNSSAYPVFKGVSITDHLSAYTVLADNGSNLSLSVNKVSLTDPDDIDYLWYGNLSPATGSIGGPVSDGGNVIKSVVYTRADEDETDSTGMIRVEFQPDYCLEEGYRYVVSYNIEASDFARREASYPDGSVGDPDTDYTVTNNSTSSGKRGYYANSFADIVYTQDDDIKIGVYEHPVIQVIMGEPLPRTGGAGTLPLYAFGLLICTGALMCGCTLRRKRERRFE